MIVLAVATWGASCWASAPLWMYKIAIGLGTFTKAGMIAWGASLAITIGGAVMGGIVGAVIAIINKKKKKASETDNAPVVDNAEID